MGKTYARARSQQVVLKGIFRGKIIERGKAKKRSLIGDWSQFKPRFGLIGFFLFIAGLALLSSGRLDSELIGLGIFIAGIFLGYLSIRDVWDS